MCWKNNFSVTNNISKESLSLYSYLFICFQASIQYPQNNDKTVIRPNSLNIDIGNNERSYCSLDATICVLVHTSLKKVKSVHMHMFTQLSNR